MPYAAADRLVGHGTTITTDILGELGELDCLSDAAGKRLKQSAQVPRVPPRTHSGNVDFDDLA